MKEIQKIIDLLDKSIKEDPNNLITWGDIIKDGFDEKVNKSKKLHRLLLSV